MKLLVRAGFIAALFGSIVLFGCSQLATTDNDFRARWSDLEQPQNQQADIEAEIRFGRAVAARLLAQYDGVDDAELQRYVNTLGQYLVQYSGRDEIDFHFWVVDSPVVNAYAAPGGYIFVTRAALAQMDNEAQLAGVLAHEIAHVREKHVVNALEIKGRSAGATIGQLTSGASDALRVALAQATDAAVEILTDTGLQQQDEFDADELALLIMVQAGYEPSAYLQLLAKLGDLHGAPMSELDQTHPPFDLRVDRANAVQQDYGLQNLNYALMEARFRQYR